MDSYLIEENKLTLQVKKSPLFIRSMLFLFSFLSFLLPLGGMIGYMAINKGFHVSFLIGLFIFSLMGIYLLRIALWNTYGKEEITFNGKHISYLVDYGWFKDALKVKEIDPICYSSKPIELGDNNQAVLVIGGNEDKFECVTRIPTIEIEKLIAELNIVIDKH